MSKTGAPSFDEPLLESPNTPEATKRALFLHWPAGTDLWRYRNTAHSAHNPSPYSPAATLRGVKKLSKTGLVYISPRSDRLWRNIRRSQIVGSGRRLRSNWSPDLLRRHGSNHSNGWRRSRRCNGTLPNRRCHPPPDRPRGDTNPFHRRNDDR